MQSSRVQQTYKDLNMDPDIPKCDEAARDWVEQKKYSTIDGKYYICEIDPI